MKVEYKISQIVRGISETWYHGKINEVQFTEIIVTDENKDKYFKLEIGEVFQQVTRKKLSEFRECFINNISEIEINQKLTWLASYYGECINTEEIWHEDKQIRIKISNVESLNMVESFPEIAIYRKENEIKTYKDDLYTYTYLSVLYPEHRALFQMFNAEILER